MSGFALPSRDSQQPTSPKKVSYFETSASAEGAVLLVYLESNGMMDIVVHVDGNDFKVGGTCIDIPLIAIIVLMLIIMLIVIIIIITIVFPFVQSLGMITLFFKCKPIVFINRILQLM